MTSSLRSQNSSTSRIPTKCKQLVLGDPWYVGVKDASSFGVGGIVVGEEKPVVPTVFRLEWPQTIRDNLVSEANPTGSITNSDLEFAGLLLLWLVMEAICPTLQYAHICHVQ
ncbi:hypothetical protein QTG54_015782 [Skeletonema marinoi]|uniref:Uncharacterized protein n=1 Tax=Skeletonema marinoi TaxID=267567 RepID=A0AAD8XTD2_9STRA|nr:hypothetical protein QTG54_015782 [Skeletonema marinoi]